MKELQDVDDGRKGHSGYTVTLAVTGVRHVGFKLPPVEDSETTLRRFQLQPVPVVRDRNPFSS